MEKIITLDADSMKIIDRLDRKMIQEKFKAGPKRTLITMTDHDTGEVLGTYENKILITASIFTATNAFGIPSPITLPNYNDELGLDHTLDYGTVKQMNTPIVCLFCIGDSGCGTMPSDVYVAKYTDRIEPENDIIPFRYVDAGSDLSDDLRQYYFGRKTIEGENKIAYYFKAFDSTPQLHLRYTDGTQINDEMYNIETTQAAECYVEVKLRITRLDFRDYFEAVSGWDKARISTLSLCYAWYDDTVDKYKWYQQIYPYSKLNFAAEWLVDLTKAIDFNYQVFY